MQKNTSNNPELDSPDAIRLNQDGYRIGPVAMTGGALLAYFFLTFSDWRALIFLPFGLCYPLYGTIRIAIALHKRQFKLARSYCVAIMLTAFISVFGDETLRLRLYIYLLMHQQQYQAELDTMPMGPRSKAWPILDTVGNDGYAIVFDDRHQFVGRDPDIDKDAVCRARFLKLPFPYYAVVSWCP